MGCNVQRLQEHVLANSPKCRERWRIPPGATIHIALHLDECTGGNVLATHSSKKIAFFHLSVDKIGKIQYHQMWLPYAMIGARCHSGFWWLECLDQCIAQTLSYSTSSRGSSTGKSLQVEFEGVCWKLRLYCTDVHGQGSVRIEAVFAMCKHFIL